MDVLWEILGFAGKGLIVFIVFGACTIVLFTRLGRLTQGGRLRPSGHLYVRRLNDSLRYASEALRGAMVKPKEAKQRRKELARLEKQAPTLERNVFVLDFKGDLMATAVEDLRQEVTAVVTVAKDGDEVVVRLESAGGAVQGYGLAASQLDRLRQRGLNLTVCVDKIAASGGYMMACVAQKIVAAPFAVLGSIGVAAPLPNFHRLLERFGIEYEDVTAGEYKRTVSPFSAVTDAGKKKFQEQIDDVHVLFKSFVKEHRPSLDIDKVATGEHWLGTRAAELGLANEIMTSDDYLLKQIEEANIYRVEYKHPRGVRERLTAVAHALWGHPMSAFGLR